MNKAEAHKRFLQAIDYLKYNGKARNHQEIALMTHTTRPNVSSAIGGNPRYVTEPFLQRFADAYSDYIRKEWLISGEGEMEANAMPMRPHLEATAAAGSMIGISEGEYGNNLREIIPDMPEYDFTITANGQSMQPRIESGDILACRMVQDRNNLPIGKICVIDSKEGWAVKVIKEIKEDQIVLHSLNPEYDDYSLDFDSILNVAVVVGMICVFD